MENDNISAAALAKGVSKDGFVKLLSDIKTAVIDEGLNELNDCGEMIEAVRQHDVNGNSVEWITNFEKQLSESSQIIKDNFKEIEELFNRMFADWEEYKKEHEDDENEMVAAQNEETEIKETKTEEVNEEVKEQETNSTDEVVEVPKVEEVNEETNEQATDSSEKVAEGDKNE